MTVRADVVGFAAGQDHTVYIVCVSYGQARWLVYRRYSAFLTLHNQVWGRATLIGWAVVGCVALARPLGKTTRPDPDTADPTHTFCLCVVTR